MIRPPHSRWRFKGLGIEDSKLLLLRSSITSAGVDPFVGSPHPLPVGVSERPHDHRPRRQSKRPPPLFRCKHRPMMKMFVW